MSTTAGDVRYALRLLRKTPAFTATAALCLGVAIGANASLFSIFNALLWKPLPVERPDALVRLFTRGPTETRLYRGFSLPEYEDYLRQNDVLSGLVATRGVQVAFRTGRGGAIRVFGEAVTDNYFDMLGLRAERGHVLGPPADGNTSISPDVVLSHRFWQTHLQSDRDIVGRTVWLTGVAYTVVGVAPPGFNGTYPSPVFAPQLWLPLRTLPLIEPASRAIAVDRSDRSLGLLGQLKPGVSLARAQAAVDTIATRLARSHPESNAGVTALAFRELDTHPEIDSSRSVNLIAALFLGLSGLVLAVACANLANLMFARAAGRRREVALRLALGAGRRQVVAELVTEAVMLSSVAAGIGLFLALAVARAVSSIRLPFDLPIVFVVTLDQRTLWFTVALSLASAAVFGLLPALAASRPDLVAALKGSNDNVTGRRHAFTAANALLVAQVASALVLVVAAGLFWRSIAGAHAVDPGLRLTNRSLVTFSPLLLKYDAPRTTEFYRRLLDRLQDAPGIERAALVGWIPLGFNFDETGVIVQGDEGPAGPGKSTEPMRSLLNAVSPAYFEAAGVARRAGRVFSERDTAASQPVAIVNETLARRAWPGLDPIGRRVRVRRENSHWLTVVGVVADGKYRTLTESPQPCLFRPLSQAPSDGLTLIVKSTAGHPAALAAIRRAVQSIDPDMPLLDAKTMEQQMAKVWFLPQAMTALAGPAAAVAILIAAIGVYGVMAHSVSRRMREFGIRLAVGAEPGELIRHVMRQGLSTVAVGMVLGLGAAAALSPVARGLLVGVSASDPAVFVAGLALLAAIAALATFLPARRAGRVDPLVTLRQE